MLDTVWCPKWARWMKAGLEVEELGCFTEKVGGGEKKGVAATVVMMQHDKVSQNSGDWNTSTASLYTGLLLCTHDCSRLWVGSRMHTGTKPTLDIFHLPWTSMDKWLKQVLSDTQPPGLLLQSKISVRKTWNYLRLSWDVRKRKKIPVMIWEIWFSPNNLPDLTPLLLPPKYTVRWVSELCLLLQVYKYMAKLIIQKKKDIEERNKDKRPHFIISSRHHCVNHFILSEPQSLQNGTFDHRQCWQPKGVK